MTPISEIIFSGFVSKVVNDIIDVPKDKIRRAVRNKNTKHQSIESQIYNVIVDVLNIKTNNRYENNQDSIYDAAAVLLKSFKENDGDELESIKSCLQVLHLNVNENECMEFKTLLYKELGKDGYSELFRTILLLLLEQKNQYDHVVYEQLNQKLDEVGEKVDNLNRKFDEVKDNKKKNVIREEIVKFQNDKKQDYIKNWNNKLFLHMDNDEKPITLADAFIMPDYKIHKSNQRIGFSENDTLDEIIEKFVKYDKTSTMLITGVPGIGKSTIASWIANEYRNDDNVIVLRFRDWGKSDMQLGLLDAICSTLGCEGVNLENKILILDGYDEMKALGDRESILEIFFEDMKDYENFKCIITSRPSYINSSIFHNIFELKEFDIERVERFYKKINGEELSERKSFESNLKILGIPVILYMAIMSGVDISENTSKPELYNHIFAEVGGIFDKFCYEGVGYDIGKQVLRDRSNIKKYLDFLQKISFAMFERNELSVLKQEYLIPVLEFQGSLISVLEFPIKHFFDNTDDNIEFIHKTIYEFFVSEYMFRLINEALDDVEISERKLAGILGRMFKKNIISIEILEFLSYKVKKSDKLKKSFYLINETFALMQREGMTFNTGENYNNVIGCELNVFDNMLEFLHLWENVCLRFGHDIRSYLKYYRKSSLNLSGVEFTNMNLDRINLMGANLKKAKLLNTSLVSSCLKGADLRDADLRGADLSDTDLSDAKLQGAKLIGIKLIGANLTNVDLHEIDLNYSVWGEKDIFRNIHQIRDADFESIFIDDQKEQKEIHRSELLKKYFA